MILRPYQVQAVEESCEALEKHGSTLVEMPTGLGKTIVFAEIAKRRLPKGRVMVIAHREELLDQARDKIQAVTGIRPDLEMADSRASEGFLKSPIVVSSVQTQTAGKNGTRRMNRFDPAEFGTLIIDEAHHACAHTYRDVIDHYTQNPACKVFGCTATPDRHDEKALGLVFSSVSFSYDIRNGIEEGYLVPIHVKYIQVDIDLDGIRYTLGDFNGKELRELLAEGNTLEKIASDTIQYVEGRRTLVFSDSVENAETLTENFNRHQFGCARIVTGETPKEERRGIIDDYRKGFYQYLVNVGVATEGFDVPEISAVVMARPTCSRALYTQMAGRGTRILPGLFVGPDTPESRKAAILDSSKPNLLVLDLVANSTKHKLVHAGDILGGNYDEDVRTKAIEIGEEGEEWDINALYAEAMRRIEEENAKRQNAEILAAAQRAEALKLKAKSRSREIDPFGVLGVVRGQERGWDEGKTIEPEIRERLERHRVHGHEKFSYTEAHQVYNEILRRNRLGLCTYRMAQILKQRGKDPNVSFDIAKGMIDEISKREGWGR